MAYVLYRKLACTERLHWSLLLFLGYFKSSFTLHMVPMFFIFILVSYYYYYIGVNFQRESSVGASNPEELGPQIQIASTSHLE